MHSLEDENEALQSQLRKQSHEIVESASKFDQEERVQVRRMNRGKRRKRKRRKQRKREERGGRGGEREKEEEVEGVQMTRG